MKLEEERVKLCEKVKFLYEGTNKGYIDSKPRVKKKQKPYRMNRIGISYSNSKEKEWLDKKKMYKVGNTIYELRYNKKTMCKLSSKENANWDAMWSNEQKENKETKMELLSRIKEENSNTERVIDK